jgi:hypothetical protein
MMFNDKKADILMDVGNQTIDNDRKRWKGKSVDSRLVHIKRTFIPHPSADAILDHIKRELAICKAEKKGVGALVISPSGSGKTTLTNYLSALYPNTVTPYLTTRPVVHMKIPKTITLKAMGTELLTQLGDPLPHKGNAQDKLKRAKMLLANCQTSIVTIDDFQDVPEYKSTLMVKDIGGWVRDLIEEYFNGLVLALGTEAAAIVRDSNPQLVRRMQAKLILPRFEVEKAAGIAAYRQFLKSLDRALPLAELSNFDKPSTVARLVLATNGILDYLFKLVKKAMIRAVEADRERIEFADFRQAFVDCHQISATCGNPFDEAYDGLALDKPGQIFYLEQLPTWNSIVDGSNMKTSGKKGGAN